MMRWALALFAAFSLAACGPQPPDLKQELRELTKHRQVYPLPQLREREPAVYRGAEFADPFSPAATSR